MNKKQRRSSENKVPSGPYCYSISHRDNEGYLIRKPCEFRRVSKRLYECKLINYKASSEKVDLLFYDACKICGIKDE